MSHTDDNTSLIDADLPIGELHPGHYKRIDLSPQQRERLRIVHEVFAELDGLSFEERVDAFKRDMHPDREIAIWERLADAYLRFERSKEFSLEAKKAALRILLLVSMGQPLHRMPDEQIEPLTRTDAADLVNVYQT